MVKAGSYNIKKGNLLGCDWMVCDIARAKGQSRLICFTKSGETEAVQLTCASVGLEPQYAQLMPPNGVT